MIKWRGTFGFTIAIIAIVAVTHGCQRDRGTTLDATTDFAFARAESTYWRGQHDSARAEWTALLSRAEVKRDSVSMGRALTRLANVAWKQADYPSARGLAERALKTPLRAEDEFVPYNVLGLVAYYQGRQVEAGPLLDRAIAIARRSGDSLNVAKATMNRGLVDTELGDMDLARQRFSVARLTAHAVHDTRLEGKCLANRAMLEIKAGDPLVAIALLDTARAFYRQSKYADGEQNALGQLGAAYSAMGEPQSALAALDSALMQSREQHLPQEEASNLQLLAEQHRNAGDFSRALDFLTRAQALNASLGMEDERGTALRDAGEIYLALGPKALAGRNTREALAIHRRTDSLLEQLADLLVLAEIEARESHSAVVDSVLRSARGIAERLGTRDARDRVALTTAEIADRSGSPREVLAAFDASGTDVASAPATEGRVLTLRARAYRRLGALDSASAIGERAIRSIERVRGRYASNALRTSYAWENGDAYADLVFVLLRQGRVDDAFSVADAARGRALLEHLAEARNAAMRSIGAARELAEGETLLRSIDELATRLRTRRLVKPNERSGADDGEEQALVTRVTRARNDYDALLDRATARDVAGATLLGAARLRTSTVRDALQSDEVMLEYFVAGDGLLIFVVSKDTVRTVSVNVGDAEFVSRVRLARELLGRSSTSPDAAHTVMGSLYDALIAPARRTGALDRAKRLIIVPHGTLVYLPFAALRNPATGRFLVEDFTPIYAPSAAAFAVARRNRSVAPNDTGTTVAFAPFPDDLPATAIEAGQVAKSAERGIVLSGRAATELALRQALGSAPLVHVATHAELNVQNPMFSAILLSPGTQRDRSNDGRLEVHELLGLQVRTSLVFLSGCETALGAAWSTSFRRGEDFTTLAQAFLYAGAHSVVATLWRIDDGAAAAFATRFYDALRLTPAPEALANAQRAMLRDRRYAAPYDWAAYEISGDASPLAGRGGPHVATLPAVAPAR